jgi:hypothetical protein
MDRRQNELTDAQAGIQRAFSASEIPDVPGRFLEEALAGKAVPFGDP